MAVQGIRGGRGYSNEPILGGYYNGAGAFCSYPVSHLYMKVVLYTPNGNRTESIDIRDYVKEQTGGRRITQNYVQQLKKTTAVRRHISLVAMFMAMIWMIIAFLICKGQKSEKRNKMA